MKVLIVAYRVKFKVIAVLRWLWICHTVQFIYVYLYLYIVYNTHIFECHEFCLVLLVLGLLLLLLFHICTFFSFAVVQTQVDLHVISLQLWCTCTHVYAGVSVYVYLARFYVVIELKIAWKVLFPSVAEFFQYIACLYTLAVLSVRFKLG